MTTNTKIQSGGKRVGAGRKKSEFKKIRMMVDEHHVRIIRGLKILNKSELAIIESNVYKGAIREGVQVHQLTQELLTLEDDARQKITELESQLTQEKQLNGSGFEERYNQLAGELFPALKRLRELVPDENW